MKNVDDIYPVTPMQEVMILHDLSRIHAGAKGGLEDDVLFNQLCYEITGDLNIPAFQQAWQQILDRHPVLRTAFVWGMKKKPLQVVRQKIELPFHMHDWTECPASGQFAKLEDFCRRDKQCGFELQKAPLMRITVIRLDISRYYLIWSSHHLLLDRWCIPILFTDLADFYNAVTLAKPLVLENAPAYREYISWLQEQSESDASLFWQKYLQGFDAPTPVASMHDPHQDVEYPMAELALSPEKTQALRRFARLHRLTLSCLVQGAWALLLNHYSGREDVLFGAAVAGRPPGLPGVESMVGTFINNVPVRIRTGRGDRLIAWLKDNLLDTQKRGAYEHVSPADIHTWCKRPPGDLLFDNILVWLAATDTVAPDGLKFRPLIADTGTAYPFTLSISEEESCIRFFGQVQKGYEACDDPEHILAHLQRVLDAILTADSEVRLSEIAGFRADMAADTPSMLEQEVLNAGSFHADRDATTEMLNGREADLPDMLQDMMLSAWQQVLGLDSITVDDDFFQIGGNSLQAVRLHARIEASTRKCVPLLSLFQTPTIARMVQMLQEESWPLTTDIVMPVQTSGHEPPLFCIATPAVNTLGYSLLARHLDDNQPLYILQAPPAVAHIRQLTAGELPDLALDYIKAMKRVQKTGPYYLLGMCEGAQLAIEIGRRLADSDEKVKFLGVINTWAFYSISKRYHIQRVINRLHYYIKRLGELGRLSVTAQGKMITGLLKRKFKASAPIDEPVASANVPGTIADTDFTPVSGKNYSLIDDVGWAQKDPDIEQFPGTVTVFRIRKQPYWRIRDKTLGWSLHADSAEIVHIPCGDHFAILREPYVKGVVQKISSSLKKTRQGHIPTRKQSPKASHPGKKVKDGHQGTKMQARELT